jgi:hypothetical protein
MLPASSIPLRVTGMEEPRSRASSTSYGTRGPTPVPYGSHPTLDWDNFDLANDELHPWRENPAPGNASRQTASSDTHHLNPNLPPLILSLEIIRQRVNIIQNLNIDVEAITERDNQEIVNRLQLLRSQLNQHSLINDVDLPLINSLRSDILGLLAELVHEEDSAEEDSRDLATNHGVEQINSDIRNLISESIEANNERLAVEYSASINACLDTLQQKIQSDTCKAIKSSEDRMKPIICASVGDEYNRIGINCIKQKGELLKHLQESNARVTRIEGENRILLERAQHTDQIIKNLQEQVQSLARSQQSTGDTLTKALSSVQSLEFSQTNIIHGCQNHEARILAVELHNQGSFNHIGSNPSYVSGQLNGDGLSSGGNPSGGNGPIGGGVPSNHDGLSSGGNPSGGAAPFNGDGPSAGGNPSGGDGPIGGGSPSSDGDPSRGDDSLELNDFASLHNRLKSSRESRLEKKLMRRVLALTSPSSRIRCKS